MNATAERPRLVIRRSLNNIFAQLIDDVNNKTLLSVSSADKDVKQQFVKGGGNIKAAVMLGEICSKKLKEKGINKIIFDRAGYLYHGRVKAFADSLRKGGLEF